MKKLGEGRERANGKGKHSSVLGMHGEGQDGDFNFTGTSLGLKIAACILKKRPNNVF